MVAYVVVLRLTCKTKAFDDPRQTLKDAGQTYIFSVLHAHQLCAILNAEAGTGAMVSRSADGQVIVPVLKLFGVIPVRGSGRRKGTGSKGGLAALDQLVDHVASGKPGYLAVDGPAGPRGHVHKGASVLSLKTGAPILPMIGVPKRRWVFGRAWDRLQLPLPFSQIDIHFGRPLYPQADETSEEFRVRIEKALFELEERFDPKESLHNSFRKRAEVDSGEVSELRQAG